MAGNWGLIDPDTPHSVYTKQSYADPSTELQLIFSDEFNVDGRSFYPGDDPYWEAIDLHYWQVRHYPYCDYCLGPHLTESRQTTWNGMTQPPLPQKMAL